VIQTLAIANYRSLRQLVVPLGRLNVITGANGSGKTNLYRALRLLADTAQGGVIASLAREGGLDSTLWAGVDQPTKGMRQGTTPIQSKGRQEPVNLRLGFAGETLSYSIDLGMPISSPGLGKVSSRFCRDPEIKRECIWAGPKLRPSALLADRRVGLVRLRSPQGEWEIARQNIALFESMLTEVVDANRAPEVLSLRDQVRSWRFYDHFRVDPDAPARQPQLGTRTPVLSHDGRDVAAALQTIREIGDNTALDTAVADAFPGSRVEISGFEGRFDIEMHQHGLLRPLKSAELSDGTLRSLLWIAALLTPRPPALMVLDEPEMSLHPDLLPAFARLIIHASKNTQIWVISHSARLVAALGEAPECQSIVLEKDLGETRIVGQGLLDRPAWEWPAR
jgi:predicted ATPase